MLEPAAQVEEPERQQYRKPQGSVDGVEEADLVLRQPDSEWDSEKGQAETKEQRVDDRQASGAHPVRR